MSDRLLKESDVMRALYKLKETVIKHKDLSYYDGLSDAFEAIQDLPSADKPQGEWISVCGNKQCDCSVCGKGFDHTYEWIEQWNYCPLCGAKMKGVDDDGKFKKA